jgi:hypothetical protein
MADCRNDCRAPIAFPRAIFNRPGLPRIGYRIGTYSDFREALFHALNRNPVLAPWTYRGADDPGIALLEGAAIVGDILTFYQEVYANELYLTTATLPVSITELVRLIGYRPSPGVGGRGVFAFEVSGDKPISIPAGFLLTADVTGLEEAADFETVDQIVARPALSKFALYRPSTTPAIAGGTTTFAAPAAQLAAAGIVLEKGTRLMLANSATAPSSYQIAVVDRVETRLDRVEIAIKGAWLGASATSITAFKLGRDFRHFGYNAPPKETVVSSGGTASQVDVDFTRTVGDDSILGFFGGGVTLGLKASTAADFPLDSQVDDLGPGATLIVVAEVEAGFGFSFGGTFIPLGLGGGYAVHGSSSETVFVVRQVTSVRNGTETRGSLTGGSTIVRLNQRISSGVGDYADIRRIQIHEVTGGPFPLTAIRTPLGNAPVTTLDFFGNGDDYEALDGRLLQFVRREPKPGEEPAFEEATAAITVSAIGDPAIETLRPVSLSPQLQKFVAGEFPLVFPPDEPPVLVYGNLAAATQGKTEKPVAIGHGDARATFQTFAIPKAPLTYLVSNSATPPEVPQLTVTVDDIEWTQVASFIGRGPKDQVYVVREDSTGASYVQFGDGETGARTSSGVGNIVITYRTGVAAFGPLKPGASADAGARLTGLDGVALLDEITGGAGAEDREKSRIAAPGTIQSLGRLVSLRDFETETLAIPGVSAASAAWAIVDDVPTIALTVLMETGRASELAAVTQLLNTYNACRGPQRYPITVRPGVRRYVYVDFAVALAPGYSAEKVFPKISAVLADLFSVPRRSFGEPEYRLRLEGVVQNVPGVTWNEVTGFGDLGVADDPATLTLPVPPRTVTPIVACDSDTILALSPAFASISEVAAPVKVC